jgi:ribulose-phosphate 3-epimerase
MVDICPTVTATDAEQYRQQVESTLDYAARLHIDLSDGSFTDKLTNVEDIWWPGGVRADLHVMYKMPFLHTNTFVALQPQMVIVHAEANGDYMAFAETLHRHGIEAGVALLPETPVHVIEPALPLIDHVLIFSGKLGHFGGHADLKLLSKATELKRLKPTLELGWDGGVSDKNAKQLASGGIDVLNAGGYLHGDNPTEAYTRLKALVES